MKNILFLNHKRKKCGVYQYGLHIFNAIKKITDYEFHYAECSNENEWSQIVTQFNYDAVIYNYHSQTFPFVTTDLLKKNRAIHIGIMHYMHDVKTKNHFQYYICGDPTLNINSPRVFKTGRLVPLYVNSKKTPDIVTIGSYGFGFNAKGYHNLVKLVQKEYDRAIIRFNITVNDVVDSNGKKIKKVVEKCKKELKKPGIQLIITHDFFDDDQLLNFLSENSINVFFYSYTRQSSGISSAVDQALAVNRPLAVTPCPLFRHLFSINPSVVIKHTDFKSNLLSLRNRPKTSSLKEILKNGIEPLKALCSEWSEQKLLEDYRRIFKEIEERNSLRFNRILDDLAREKYQDAIGQLQRLSPKMIKRKIPRANVQQAFVFDTVRHFAKAKSKILCVGAYEDTALDALIKSGYQIEFIDPVINVDLNTFFQESDKRNSYDIIFSTSVVEHVKDDELFFLQISELLASGGVAILTCDFNDQFKKGDPIFQGNYRFYTQADFFSRILPILKNCSLVDEPKWNCENPDFFYGGMNYTFATLVFKKNVI